MTAFTPRPARADDAAALAALAREAYAVYVPRIGREPGPMVDDYPARVANDIAHLVEDDAGVLGFVVLIEKPDGSILLDNVAVARRAQGRGLGRFLVAFAEAEAARRGYPRLDLYTHVRMTENIAMYERLGYVETRRVTERGFERVYMSKALAGA